MVFIREVVRLHGIPRSIVSDRDKVFVSKFWREIFKQQGTTLKLSTAYHPQTDGQTEVVNRSLEAYLRCFTSDRPKEWIRWLPWAEFWYNTSFHSTIRNTPFKVLYGRDPPRVLSYDRGSATTFEVDRYLADRDTILADLREHFLRAQQLMKGKADTKRRDVSFETGDLVYLKLRPYRQGSVVKRYSQKLAARYFGPFEVLERVGSVAYRLQLPPGSTVHPVFHVSQLKKAVGDHPVETALPNEWGAELVLFPRDVRGTREVDGLQEVLIAWEGTPDGEETWEPYDQIRLRFPHFHLEDKVVFRGGGDDALAAGQEKRADRHWGSVYSRRNK